MVPPARETQPSAAVAWGSTAAERAEPYHCDRLTGPQALHLFRAIDVEAPTRIVFCWLCQMRAAPYSYDLLDNFGRRSPREADPALTELEPGQRFMRIFRLVHVEPGRSVTLETRSRALGRVVVTYRTTTRSGGGSRIVVKLAAEPPAGLLGAVIRRLGPAGDLVMMRRQLRTLRALAERDAEREERASRPPEE